MSSHTICCCVTRRCVECSTHRRPFRTLRTLRFARLLTPSTHLDAQVELIDRFIGACRKEQSLCHQLIMGQARDHTPPSPPTPLGHVPPTPPHHTSLGDTWQGKTTVIAPLLALMIADGQRLVISIVPPHLLPSARAVLREKLTASLQRPVYGMRFDRYTAVTPSVLELLRHAAALRGVLLTEPSTIKSVMLKFVDALVELQGEVEPPQPPPPEEMLLIWRLQKLLGLRRRRGLNLVRRTDRKHEIKVEVDTLASVLGLFRRSVALLDEVDVLLHPLRSELNWPQGERHPIHFAPLRWQLPFHLLDGALYPDTKLCTATWHESPEAQQLLSQLCEVTAEGKEQCALQGVPHMILLERSFYEERIRPLLTHWALLWLRRNRVQQGSDEHIVAYLSRDAPKLTADPAAAATAATNADDPLNVHAREAAAARDAAGSGDAQRWQWLVTRLSAEHMQLLNLARTWLHSVLPHILCKVCKSRLRPRAPACSRLLPPAPAFSRLLLPSPACSNLIQPSPTFSNLLSPSVIPCIQGGTRSFWAPPRAPHQRGRGRLRGGRGGRSGGRANQRRARAWPQRQYLHAARSQRLIFKRGRRSWRRRRREQWWWGHPGHASIAPAPRGAVCRQGRAVNGRRVLAP